MMARTHSHRLAQARWEVAGPLPDDSRQLLTPHEQRYETRYNELLSEFQTQYGLDLTRDSTPPSDNLIKARPPAGAHRARRAAPMCGQSPGPPDSPTQVHVLEDVGKFVGPESGATIQLKRGDHPFLRRGDVEHLVRQGILEHEV